MFSNFSVVLVFYMQIYYMRGFLGTYLKGYLCFNLANSVLLMHVLKLLMDSQTVRGYLNRMLRTCAKYFSKPFDAFLWIYFQCCCQDGSTILCCGASPHPPGHHFEQILRLFPPTSGLRQQRRRTLHAHHHERVTHQMSLSKRLHLQNQRRSN